RRRRQGGDRADRQGGRPPRRLVYPLRQQLRGPDRQPARAGGHPHLRTRGARAARQALHEDRIARSGGPVSRLHANKAGSGVRPARVATRLRKGDTVLVVAGKEKGKTGKLLRMVLEKNRATVERLNMVKRHRKGRGPQSVGGIVEKEAPLHI